MTGRRPAGEGSGLRPLAQLLQQTATFWQFPEFADLDYPWREELPALARYLDGLTEGEVERLAAAPAALAEAVASWIPEGGELLAAATLPELPAVRAEADLPDSLFRGVRGRKETQVRAFVQRVPEVGLPILDWCSGKGHLARALVGAGAGSALCLEWDRLLCAAGEGDARRDGMAVAFAEVDVLEASPEMEAGHHAVALHACGDLHRQLLERVVEVGTGALSYAPCCYQRTSATVHQAMSEEGRTCGLQLGRDDLRMVLQETVVAGPRARRRNMDERLYRLGFDLLQRELLNSDAYLSVPSVPGRVISDGFEAFCRWAGQKRGIEIPDGVDFDAWEQRGVARAPRVARTGLLRALFRRPLEVWLVRDQAAYLEEAGYHVQMGTFCPRTASPRNIMVDAKK